MSKQAERTAWGGAFDVFGKMFERVKANPHPAILLAAAYVIVVLLEELVVLGKAEPSVAQLLWFGLLETAFFLVFLLALPTYGWALARGEKISIGELMRFDARKYVALLAGGFLYSLAIVGSLILLIIPVIWVLAWFALYQIVVVDRGLGPVQALKESKRLIRNDKRKVWGIIGATILFSLLVSLLTIVPIIGAVLSAVDRWW